MKNASRKFVSFLEVALIALKSKDIARQITLMLAYV